MRDAVTLHQLGMQILEEEAALCFHLQQQQLIELIRTGKVEDALAFAQEFLAYKGEENEALLEELGVCFSSGQHVVCTCLSIAVPCWDASGRQHVLPCTCKHFKCACRAESTIALIAFPNPDESPVKSLMSPVQRQLTARAVNSAILRRSCQDVEPRLTATLRMLMWGQEKLAETVKFPHLDWKCSLDADSDAL